MFRLLYWSLAAIASVAFTVLTFLPAAWLSSMLEMQTGGRLTLGDAQGTLWNGSAYIGAAPGGNNPVTPLLPGRFTWKISPTIFLGRVDVELENASALSEPVRISGSWTQWQISHATLALPAERLAALGAPLNTIQPSGEMRLTWQLLQPAYENGYLKLIGIMHLTINDLASRLSPVNPLGDYDLEMDWKGSDANVTLKTLRGKMLLDGSGNFRNGRLQFSGTAQAETGQEEKLANLLYLLGQRRNQGDKEIISLEFK
ncbi:MAG: type II secretion system protein N [Gallionella sp.]